MLVTKVVEDEGPGLTLSLDYRKIELETFGQDDKGAFGPAGQFGYDLAANKDGVSVGSVVPSGSVAPSPQPTTYFMLIDGLDGGATDKSHAGWFEITGFDLDLANIGSTSTGSGAGAGKADFSRLEPFRKELESRESLVIPWTAPDSEVPHLEAGTSSDRRPARLALRE